VDGVPVRNPSAALVDALEGGVARLFEARRRARRHTIRLLAAGVAFYAFLALFPGLGAAVSIVGLMPGHPAPPTAGAIARATSPARASLRELRRGLARQPRKHLGAGAVVGLLVSLWSASRGAAALMKALNEIYERRETRGYLRSKGIALVLTLSSVVMVVIAALVAAAIPTLLGFVGLGDRAVQLISALRWPLMLLVITAALGPVYRYGPCHPEPRPRWLSTGALTAALMWDAGSACLSLYLGSLTNLDRTYGGVAATVALLLWLYVAAIAVLFGAAVNAGAVHGRSAEAPPVD
jgi:membrane protein